MNDDVAQADLESRTLEVEASKLDWAISSLLQTRDSQANDWITNFVTLPQAWSVSLYLACPPAGSAVGGSPDVRFFALNLLLSKIRGDYAQLPAGEAQEIYEALIQQLPLNLENQMVGARLCLVVSSAAALAGADTCFELVESIVGGFIEGPLAVELLINLAEETLHRSTALPWQVGECMQECSPQVLTYLESLVTSPAQQNILSRVLVCLERWTMAGLTLSELYSENAPLFKVVLGALGSPDDASFDGAVATLLEFITAVDPLPGREEAVRATMSAILTQKGQFVAAMSSPTDVILNRARGLLSLVGAISSAEPYLLARGGEDSAGILEWLVLGLGGGGNLGLEGASIAAESWIRLVVVPKSKRTNILQNQFFAAGAQSILQVTKYPPEFDMWQQSEVDEDEFYRFREGLAKEGLVACFSELGSALLSHIVERLQAAANWQDAEVCLYAAASLSKEVLAMTLVNKEWAVKDHQVELGAAKSFLLSIIRALPGSVSVIQRDLLSLPHPRLVETASRLMESYADLAASDASTLETTLSYIVGALYISDASSKAAGALRELCRAAAPSIAAAGVLPALVSACEEALVIPVESSRQILRTVDRVMVIHGLAQVAAALPLQEARIALSSLTASATYTVKALAGVDQMDDSGPRLAEALRVIVVAIDSADNISASHPGLVIIHEIWPAVSMIATHWAADIDVSSAVCELWAITARKVGLALSEVLPEVIVSATALFKQHHAPACVECLADVLVLTSEGVCMNRQLEETLANSLLQLSEVGNSLAQGSEVPTPGNKHTTDLHRLAESGRLENVSRWKQQSTAAGLQALCQLGRVFLQYQPVLLVTSPVFSVLVDCAIGCIRRKELAPTLSAVNFLAESVLGLGYTDKDNIDRIAWRLPQELSPYVDIVVGFHLPIIVEVALKTATASQLLPISRDAISDIFYGLCLRYAEGCRAAMKAAFSTPDFPSKPGILTESVKSLFVATAVRQPVHPRRRFHNLLGDFARICQGQMPTNVLDLYR